VSYTSRPMAFRVPTRVVIEPGCRRRLAAVAAGYGPGPATLVVDPGLAATPWPGEAAEQLAAAGLDAAVFSAVEANPRAETVERLAGELRRRGGRLVVALGGGSVLDAAKGAAMLATNGGRLADYEGAERFRERPLPLIALPTTCGTGSEVTWVAVVSLPERRAKISVKGEAMFPAHALVDADLLATLPARLVAWTGLDALTHALEACTGRRANPASDALAERAVSLVFRHLRQAAAGAAEDREAREGMAAAATLAGLAFGNADVAAVHCLSETLGGLYDLPHGLVNGLLLAPVLRAHGPAVTPRLAVLARRLGMEWEGEAGAGEALLAAVEGLVTDLGLPSFGELGIPPGDFEEIAARAAANGSNPSNPRPMGPPEYLEILRRLGRGPGARS
jgi:alcohol dehydrogenase class IV